MSKELLAKLSEPFKLADLSWKPQRAGIGKSGPWAMVVPYVDARAVMDRLDQVMGPAGWQNKVSASGKGFLSELSLFIDGQWITKVDGSDETDIEAFKGGISKAMVRSAVLWGIGRYLYALPTMWADFSEVHENTEGSIQAKIEGNFYYWVPPLHKMPIEALCPEEAEARREKRRPEPVAVPKPTEPKAQVRGPQPAPKPQGKAPMCCGKPMRVSKFNEHELYCLECKKKLPVSAA